MMQTEEMVLRGLEIGELEAFLTLAEELHFGRTGERLYVSQGRISQLLRSLESRIGARLVERTSRRVRLTPLGEQFLDSLRPAYAALQDAVADTQAMARGTDGILRIGFQGSAGPNFLAVVERFRDRHPSCQTEIIEVPLSDPFGPVRRHEVDLAAVLLPMSEPDLIIGATFSRQQQRLALSVDHPYAARTHLSPEDLATVPLISAGEPAPDYWREAHAPSRTPEGQPIRSGPIVRTLQEGLTLAASKRGGLLLCQPTGEQFPRTDLVHLPVRGLPDSALALVWHRDRETARTRAFAQAIADNFA